MKIQELCEGEKPREKMLRMGASSLSNGELLAILLRTGIRGLSVLDMAQLLLKSADASLVTLSSMSMDQLCAIPGIKSDKACSVAAAMELGRRFMTENTSGRNRRIMEARDAYRALLPCFKGLQHEECWVLALNRSNSLIGRKKISSGGLSSTTMDVQVITKYALEVNASGIILAHNHPSHNPAPSGSDIRYTESLKKALGTMNILLLDHIVVCDSSWFSFSEESTGR